MLSKCLLAALGLAALLAASMLQAAQKPSAPLQAFAQAKPTDYVGDERCAGCHEEVVDGFPKSPHAIYVHNQGLSVDRQGCESCHGPGRAHIESQEQGKHIIAYGKLSPKEVVDACLRCHGDLMKKPHFRSEAHARAGLSCISCHQIHPKPAEGGLLQNHGLVKHVFAATKDSNPLLRYDEATLCNECHKPEVAAFRKSSHHPVPEGRLTCSDCHSIHPTNADKLKKSSIKDNCVTCHSEIAGPFVYEHDPVAGWTGGGCVECHNPHGSQNPKLLVAFSRGLCLQCHTAQGGSNHFPGQSCWVSGCHAALHGSNHDPRLLVK